MTAHRRPHLILAAAAWLLPACISIQADAVPVVPAEEPKASHAQQVRRTEFAALPSRPGIVIHPNQTKELPADPPVPPPDANVMVATEPGTFPVGPVRSAVPAEPPLLAALRAHAEGRPDKAIEVLQGLEKPNQELVLALLPVLAHGATGDLVGDPAGVAALVDQLRTVAARLEPRAALRIENVRFCRRVDGFGQYDPWPEGQPYRPYDRAQLYLEVRNLTSQPMPGPNGETHLTHAVARVEIRDAHGKRVPQPNRMDGRRWVETVQYETRRLSRGPLHDFHLLYPFEVPKVPGVYEITVELHDPVSRRTVKTKPIRFDVAGP